MTAHRLAAAIALAGSVVACAPGAVRVTHPEIRSQYSMSEMFYALDRRDTEVVVNGSPFAGRSAAAATTDVMNQVRIGPRTNFTVTPGDTARRPYRVVLAYDPAVPLTGIGLCARPEVPVRAERREEIALQGALCHGPNLLTAAYATAGPVSGPDDPRFVAMVVGLTRALFPPYNPLTECTPNFIRNC
jgi:hypothetical protein